MKASDLLDLTTIPEGSIVAVRIKDATQRRMVEIANDLKKHGKARGISFIVMPEQFQMECLDEATLKSAGLMRINGRGVLSC